MHIYGLLIGSIFSRYSKVKLWEVCLPKATINVRKTPKNIAELIDSTKSISIVGYSVYSIILEILSSLKESSSGSRLEGTPNSFECSLKNYLLRAY